MLLQIDMGTMTFSAASCALSFLAGKSVCEVTGKQGVELLSRVAHQVLSLEERGLLTAHFFPFGNFEFRWGTSIMQRSMVDGTIEILRCSNGGLHLMMCFTSPRKGSSSPGPRELGRQKPISL